MTFVQSQQQPQSLQMDFRRPSSSISVDRKTSSTFFDDSTDILDDAILDSSVMSPTGSTTGIFSPDSLWDESFPAALVDRTSTGSTNPFLDQNTNNPWRSALPQHNEWSAPDRNSGARTPTASKPFDAFGHDFDTGPSQYSTSVGSSSTAPFGVSVASNVRPSSVFSMNQSESLSQPLSPHNSKDWMDLVAQQMDSRPTGPKRMRPNTPPRYPSPFPRRDGIRKKNARFEIPAERSLTNIDQLIANSKDEEEIKELKQQKRLLRNRQAALDSRQRKKKHTEELEEEKKIWQETMARMEEDLAGMRLQLQNTAHEKDHWIRQALEAKQSLDVLQLEHEELVRSSTLETGDLRKKVSVLSEELRSGHNHVAAAPSSASFTEFASDMDHLNMGPNDWDNYIFVDEYCGDQVPSQPAPDPPVQSATSLVLSHRKKEAPVVSEDKPVASGLLLMLLLCGAFVASKSSGGTSPAMPRMPDDVRAASATVLDSIFKDAGVGSSPNSAESQTHGFIADRVRDLENGPSQPRRHKSTAPGIETASMSSNPDLSTVQSSLTRPTKDQENEQLFSITPAQYNNLMSTDFSRRPFGMHGDDATGDPMSPDPQVNSHRRNLAETLAAMREDNKGDSAAEVYTRSLLWERIPSEVVHEFKRMVEESDRISSSSSVT